MPRNSSGVYTLPEPPVVTATTIESADENSTRDDLAAELTNSLDRNGRGGMIAPLRIPDGSVTVPGLAFNLDVNTGIYRIGTDAWALVAGGGSVIILNTTQALLLSGGVVGAGYLGATNGFQLDASVPLGWSSGTVPGSNDVELRREAANILAQRRGVNAQTFRFYNTFTDPANYEVGELAWTANTFHLRAYAGGTGVQRALQVGTIGNASVSFYTNNVIRWFVQAGSGGFIPNVHNTYDIGEIGAPLMPRIGYFGTALSVGAVPSTSGHIRLPTSGQVATRNAANSADVALIQSNASDQVVINAGSAAPTLNNQSFHPSANNTFDLGTSTGPLKWRDLLLSRNADIAGALTIGGASIPQNSQSTAYQYVAADANKHVLHPSADTSARVFTMPANGTVPFEIGTAITIVNQNAAGVLTLAITTDTQRWAGPGTTGSRTLAANGIANYLKVTATEWIISGVGLS